MNKNFNPERIKSALAEIARKAKVSANVFTGNRVGIPDENLSDFVVVSMSSSLRDLETHGRAIFTIQMFAKETSKGQENSKKISLMYDRACEMNLQHEDYIFQTNPTIIPLGSDKKGFTVNGIQIQTLIKSV